MTEPFSILSQYERIICVDRVFTDVSSSGIIITLSKNDAPGNIAFTWSHQIANRPPKMVYKCDIIHSERRTKILEKKVDNKRVVKTDKFDSCIVFILKNVVTNKCAALIYPESASHTTYLAWFKRDNVPFLKKCIAALTDKPEKCLAPILCYSQEANKQFKSYVDDLIELETLLRKMSQYCKLDIQFTDTNDELAAFIAKNITDYFKFIDPLCLRIKIIEVIRTENKYSADYKDVQNDDFTFALRTSPYIATKMQAIDSILDQFFDKLPESCGETICERKVTFLCMIRQILGQITVNLRNDDESENEIGKLYVKNDDNIDAIIDTFTNKRIMFHKMHNYAPDVDFRNHHIDESINSFILSELFSGYPKIACTTVTKLDFQYALEHYAMLCSAQDIYLANMKTDNEVRKYVIYSGNAIPFNLYDDRNNNLLTMSPNLEILCSNKLSKDKALHSNHMRAMYWYCSYFIDIEKYVAICLRVYDKINIDTHSVSVMAQAKSLTESDFKPIPRYNGRNNNNYRGRGKGKPYNKKTQDSDGFTTIKRR